MLTVPILTLPNSNSKPIYLKVSSKIPLNSVNLREIGLTLVENLLSQLYINLYCLYTQQQNHHPFQAYYNSIGVLRDFIRSGFIFESTLF